MIARVFPRKTAMSPTDALAFFGQPTIENIADCIKAGVTEVHISVTFTWDLEKTEDLYYAWQILGVPIGMISSDGMKSLFRLRRFGLNRRGYGTINV